MAYVVSSTGVCALSTALKSNNTYLRQRMTETKYPLLVALRVFCEENLTLHLDLLDETWISYFVFFLFYDFVKKKNTECLPFIIFREIE